MPKEVKPKTFDSGLPPIVIDVPFARNIKTKTECELNKETGEISLVATVSFSAEADPDVIAKLLKIQKKGLIINAQFSSAQYELPEPPAE